MDSVSAMVNRGAGFTRDDGQDGTTRVINHDEPSVKAFNAYIRHGADRVGATELKALTVSDDARGGYLVPPMVASQIIRVLREFSPVRQLARVVQTSGDKLDYPTVTSGPTAYWTGEVETRTETTVAFGDITL